MNANVNVEEIVDNKELREQYISRMEVLDKVKKLFLIPKLDMMTSRQVAEYYGVDYNTVKLCYQRNEKEISSDGVITQTPRNFKDFLKVHNVPLRSSEQKNGKFIIDIDDNIHLEIPNRGIRCFSKRAVLRFGMLLRDSDVAKEVRTQLLNVVEKVEETKPEILTEEIDREKELLNNVALAWASGDMMKFAEATMKLNAFKDRHIKEIENANRELTEKNELLTEDNKILAGDILAWSNRASANKIVRIMAGELKWYYGSTWNKIYDELNYRYGINLKIRQGQAHSNKPLIEFLHDNEYEKLYKTIAAMLQERYINPSRIFKKAKVELEST